MAAAAQERDRMLAEIPLLRETIGNMDNSITHLQRLLAGLLEDPTGEYPDMGEGPSVRARQYRHALDSDRLQFTQLKENVENLESVIAELSATQTHNFEHIENELTNIRTEMGAARHGGTSSSYERRTKALVEIKGVEKLKSCSGDPFSGRPGGGRSRHGLSRSVPPSNHLSTNWTGARVSPKNQKRITP